MKTHFEIFAVTFYSTDHLPFPRHHVWVVTILGPLREPLESQAQQFNIICWYKQALILPLDICLTLLAPIQEVALVKMVCHGYLLFLFLCVILFFICRLFFSLIFEIVFHRLWTPYHCDKPWRNHTNSKKRSMQLNGCSWYHSSSIGIIRSTRPTGCSGSWERHHHGGTLSTSIIKTRELRRKSCFKCSNTLSYTRMFSYRTKLTPTNTSFQGEASFLEWRKEHGLKTLNAF